MAGAREAGSEEKEDVNGSDGDDDDAFCGGGQGVAFPPEVAAWQLQRRLQNKVLRLEKRLGSRVSSEDIEGEVEVREKK